MIIVSGKIYVQPGTRQKFLASSHEAIVQARKTVGCQDFIIAADPIEAERVNVYEEWNSEEELLDFRGNGADQELQSLLLIEQSYAANARVIQTVSDMMDRLLAI